MESIRTLYRLVVMSAMLSIAVMAWRLYGPPLETCRSLVKQGLERIQSQIYPPGERSSGAVSLSTSTIAPLAGAPVFPEPPAIAPPPLAAVEAQSGPLPHQLPIPREFELAQPSPAAALEKSPASGGHDRLTELLNHLAELDVRQPHLAPWGSGGGLYRFCCQAAWGSSGQFSRHFESVAIQPEEAVANVLAQVHQWRASDPIAR